MTAPPTIVPWIVPCTAGASRAGGLHFRCVGLYCRVVKFFFHGVQYPGLFRPLCSCSAHVCYRMCLPAKGFTYYCPYSGLATFKVFVLHCDSYLSDRARSLRMWHPALGTSEHVQIRCSQVPSFYSICQWK